MEQSDVTISSLDAALIALIGTLLMPVEASEKDTLVSYPREVILEALDALSERLEAYLQLKELE